MGKKNTLLYLDSDLVGLAKRMKVNISEITESAIKEKLLPILSCSEKMIFDIESYLEEMESINSCFFLPFPIRKVEVKNMGPISSVSMEFGRGINIINGRCGTGKTLILRAMALAFGIYTPEKPSPQKHTPMGRFLKHDEKGGYIKILIYENEKTMKFDASNPNGKRDGGCLLLDDAIARLPEKEIKRFINKLKNKYPGQIIMTTIMGELKLPNAKIFNLRNGKI